jgi:hypothetical protein
VKADKYCIGNIGTDGDGNTRLVVFRPSGSVIFIPLSLEEMLDLQVNAAACVRREVRKLRAAQ